jgi:predicted DNA binding protein
MSSTSRSSAPGNRTAAASGRSKGAAPRPDRWSYSTYRISVRLGLSDASYLFSHRHPELRVEILGRLDVDRDHQIAEVRIRGPHAGRYAEEMRRLPGVSRADAHSESEGDAHYRVHLLTGAGARAMRAQQVLARYPMVLQDGWLHFETIATVDRLRALLRHLEEHVGPTRAGPPGRGPLRPGDVGLTVAQDEVFRAALQSGYFNAPRGISLTELARRLGRSKSTVSQQLTRIQRRLAQSALRLEMQTLPTGLS